MSRELSAEIRDLVGYGLAPILPFDKGGPGGIYKVWRLTQSPHPPSPARKLHQCLLSDMPTAYGIKFNSSGNGGTMGTSNSGMGPSGSMTSVPSEAKNSAICACAPREMPSSRGDDEKGTLLKNRKACGSFGTTAGSMAKARSFR